MLIDTKEIKHLVNSGFVSEKKFNEYPDLRMYKYKNKVFYKNLWNTSPMLTECRGLVLDTKGNVVVLPFEKVFNYKENGKTIRKDAIVKAVEKKNGFFAAASLYQGKVLVSTTGSLDSDFTKMAKTVLPEDAIKSLLIGMKEALGFVGTALFEICHKDDPHIIEEDIGAYLIGFRVHSSGLLVSEEILDRMAYATNVEAGTGVLLRPQHTYCTFKQLLKKVKGCAHEGYMAYQKDSNKVVKLKSPHYLSKKFLMRMGDTRIHQMYANAEEVKKTIDEEFYGVVDYVLTYPKDFWLSASDQHRRKVIEEYFQRN